METGVAKTKWLTIYLTRSLCVSVRHVDQHCSLPIETRDVQGKREKICTLYALYHVLHVPYM